MLYRRVLACVKGWGGGEVQKSVGRYEELVFTRLNVAQFFRGFRLLSVAVYGVKGCCLSGVFAPL